LVTSTAFSCKMFFDFRIYTLPIKSVTSEIGPFA
jgi:hypothetical protein